MAKNNKGEKAMKQKPKTPKKCFNVWIVFTDRKGKTLAFTFKTKKAADAFEKDVLAKYKDSIAVGR